jgi:hypothetical protein
MLLYLEDITRSMGESQGGYAQDKNASQKEALTNFSPTCGHLCIDLKVPFTFFLRLITLLDILLSYFGSVFWHFTFIHVVDIM